MRVSRRRRGGGSSRCAPGSSLDWGLQRLAGSGVWRLLCGLLQSGPRRTAATPALWRNGRFGPGPSGREERERKRAQTVWRGGFRRGRVRPTPIPPGRLLTSDCRGSASPRGDSALAATSAGSSGQSAWAWSAAADSAFRAPLAPVWPKAIARQAPMGLGSALWPLGFGTWPWRCRLCPFLLSSPLHLAQARLGAQAPRCPGVQVSRRSGRHGRARSLGIRTSPRLPRPAGFAPPVPVRIRFGPLASGYCASGSRAARLRPIPVWPLALQAAYMGAP